tara:strand:+ start:127 stop:396 length:270 start_codon:yes stop_codon:yes gene_type:complete
MDKEIEPEEITEEVDEDVYTEEGRANLIEDDEIEDQEQAFAEGYENENLTICATCGDLLKDDVVEKEVDDVTYRFCSEECANNFKKKEN